MMKGFMGLTKRNLLIFFKDRQTVLFSLLTSIIVLVLYLLFLKSSFIDAINNVLNSYNGLENFIKADEIDMFANLILLTGIIGSALITVPYNCLETLVKDKENKVDYDILATPIKRGQIILSYFISAAISSILLTSIILVIGLAVIHMQGNIYMTSLDILKAFLLVAFGSISATAFFMIIILFFKSSSASGAFFGMLSAASGFVIGAYIPISQFSDTVQTICNVFPASQITIILRNIFMNGILKHMNESLNGIDHGLFVESIKNVFSFEGHMFGSSLEVNQMLIYIFICIIICIIVQIIVYSKTYKKN